MGEAWQGDRRLRVAAHNRVGGDTFGARLSQGSARAEQVGTAR